MSGFLHWALWAVTGAGVLLAGMYGITAYTEAKGGDRRVVRSMAACSALFLAGAAVTGLAAGYLR